MARQLIVQAHFLHLTSHAIGRPRPRPVMPPIIGEQKGKIHLLRGRRSGRSASLRKVQQPRFGSFQTVGISRAGKQTNLRFRIIGCSGRLSPNTSSKY
jgi:hypothetical protein